MKVMVVLEYRFDRTPDGGIWTETAFSESFWGRYLRVFDEVKVVARVKDVNAVPARALRSDGPFVHFIPVPYYVGPYEYLTNVVQVKAAVRGAFAAGDAVILRVSSPLAGQLVPHLTRIDYPFGLEVVGDPYDVFAPGTVRHPLRPFFRWWFTRQLRNQCQMAAAVSYVTTSTLQRRYPASPKALSTYYSSIELPDQAFALAPRKYVDKAGPFTIITVGALAQLYKGTDTLVDAAIRCVNEGKDVHLIVVGDGAYRGVLEERAKPLGNRCQFLGQVPSGQSVRDLLDRADLFVLPSRTEGLPRAMIEAMARALPCLGSNVGGIPELLPPEDLVPSDAPEALAEKIMGLMKEPRRMEEMSSRNLVEAANYRDDKLAERRRVFYTAIKRRTQEWLAAQGRQVEGDK